MIPVEIGIFLCVIAGCGIYARIYYGNKLRNENRKADFDIFFRKTYNITTLFPIIKRKYGQQDASLIRNANIGLIVFYIAMCLIALLAYLNSKSQ